LRNKPKLADPVVLRVAVRETLARFGWTQNPGHPKIEAPPMEEGPAGRETKASLGQAIARFNPDIAFTEKCLARMAFSDRYLSDKEKLVVLEMVKRYAQDMQQLTLVNFIGYLHKTRSEDANLSTRLADMRRTGTVLDVGPCRRADDQDLLLELSSKTRPVKARKDVGDDDY
jgi:hypothetical protein